MPYPEKRRCVRVPFTTKLAVLDTVTQQTFEAASIDLSASGAQFYAGKFFAVGTRICIRLSVRQADRAVPVELRATVRWARVEKDGAIMGVEFDAPLSPGHCPELYDELFARP